MSTQFTQGVSKATETILSKLEAALNADGDFPVRARVVSDLRRLVNDPNTPVEKIVETILSEPSLGTRILHLVNSVCYKRSQPVITVSQAVIQLGMRALCELCSGFVLMQRFSPAAQKGGVFADNLKKCILCPALTSSLVLEHGKADEAEQGYLAGTFFSIGPLLLAFYFPQIFETAEKRAQARKQTITQSVTESIGIPPVGLSLGVVDALAIPQFYRDLLVAAYSRFVQDDSQLQGQDYRSMANMLATSARIADAIIDTRTVADLSKQLDEISNISGLSKSQINLVLKQMPESFKQHCKMIEMAFLTLPEHFIQYLDNDGKVNVAAAVDESSVGDDFSFYLDEIRQAIANRETMSSIITTAMEALAFGQRFDRVLLLYMDDSETTLVGKMALGESFGSDPKSIQRDLDFLDYETAPDIRAMVDGSVEVFGDPLFPNGWPFAVIPVGNPENVVGVIYADMINNNAQNAKPLDSGVKVALNLLAELLEQAVSLNAN
jgi:hypothetical protein